MIKMLENLTKNKQTKTHTQKTQANKLTKCEA